MAVMRFALSPLLYRCVEWVSSEKAGLWRDFRAASITDLAAICSYAVPSRLTGGANDFPEDHSLGDLIAAHGVCYRLLHLFAPGGAWRQAKWTG